MKSSDLIALDYRLKHAKSKKAVLKMHPELTGKTVSQVRGLILVNIMLMTGKDLKEQKQNGLRKKLAMMMRRRSKHG
jgi:hypothetical protein